MENENDDTSISLDTEVPATDSSTVESTETSDSKEEIMIPKSRFDEVNAKLKELRSQPKQTSKTQDRDVESIIDQKLAPLKVQIETESVIRKYSDFSDFANGALTEIKKNPSLSLEDGYLLAKAKSGTSTSKAKEEGKKEAYQTIEKKENLSFETSGPKKSARPVEDLIQDKTVSLQEIAKMLPRS